MFPDRPRRLLFTALLLAHPLAQAAETAPAASEWRCKPAASGQGWDCQTAPVAPGPYRPAPLPPKSAATPPGGKPAMVAGDTGSTTPAAPDAPVTASREASAAELDWVPRAELPAELLASTSHCSGAYIDPLAGVDKAANRPEDANLKVSADTGELAEDNERFVLQGGIAFSQGYRQGRSERAVVERDEDRIILDGGVELREPGLLLRADSAEINTANSTGSARNVLFVAHTDHVRGSAGSLQRPGEGLVHLSGATYTTCEPGNAAWLMGARDIHLDQNTGIGSASHAVLELQGVPVAWIPYLEFPIDDRRMTGVLWPHFGHGSRSGTDVAVPYYLNLAPNYDATITPRYLSQRGPMLEVEGRYQSPVDEWTLGIGYLNDDSRYVDDRIEENLNDRQQLLPMPPLRSAYNVEEEDRWLVALNEQGTYTNGWRSRIDYTRVSDDEYLRDLDTIGFEARRQTHLEQRGEVAYTGNVWAFTASVEDHQTIGRDNSDQYALLPHLELVKSASGEAFRPDWLLLADYSFFDHDKEIRGQRLYAEPGVTFPMRWDAGFLQPTVKLRHVNYAMPASNENGVVYDYTVPPDDPLAPRPIMDWPDDPEFFPPQPGSEIAGRPSATVPMFSLDAGLVFERDLRWRGYDYLQTLEPRVYYLYADYEEQDNLPNFDTGETDSSYQRLFSETRFNGYDRLDDANQTSVGLVSRFIDQQSGRDILALGVGQTFYNEDLLVSTEPGVPYTTAPYSEIAAVAMYTPSDAVTISGNISWDPDNNRTSEGGIEAQWLPADNWVLNLGYRYSREDPSLVAGSCLLGLPPDQTEFDWTCDYNEEDIDQVDFSSVIPLSRQWRLFTKLHYDITNHESLESLVGLEYESCCWMVRFAYQESLDGALDTDNNDFVADDELERDYAFYIQFQLKGLGDLADKLDSLLDEAIPGFDRLYGIKK